METHLQDPLALRRPRVFSCPAGDPSAAAGLDLGRTETPIADTIDDFERVYPDSPVLYAVEVHERLVPEPLAALPARFGRSELHIDDLAGPTGRHGVLLGTKRWRALRRPGRAGAAPTTRTRATIPARPRLGAPSAMPTP